VETVLTIIFGLTVFGASAAALSLEYYARKAKVVAAPSVPWMRKAVIERLKRESGRNGAASPLILELGSGWGTLALAAARACPAATVVGYEISPIPLFFSRLRARVRGLKNTRFLAADLFREDFSGADIVLTYLTMPHMALLKDKFEAELKPGATVICNTFPVPDWTPSEEETIQNFVYELKVYTFRR